MAPTQTISEECTQTVRPLLGWEQQLETSVETRGYRSMGSCAELNQIEMVPFIEFLMLHKWGQKNSYLVPDVIGFQLDLEPLTDPNHS